MTNPLVDPYFILTKVYSGGKYLKQAISETAIEPLNKARTVKIVYGVLEKDGYLSYIIEQNTQSNPKSAVRLVLKIALYMLEFMSKHDYMVVDSAVELIKKSGKGGAAGFVNAFLRSYKIPELPQKADEALAISCSAPLWLTKKVKRSYKGLAKDILTAPSLGVCVRFKDEKSATPYLEREHIETPFKNAYIFKNFVRDEGFVFGDYTFQSVGSIAICTAISPVERLLDVCSAPGGKAVLLSQKCKEVTACELHEHRVELIKSYAGRMGATNVTVRQADGTVFVPEFENAFDAVLCDAPCSGTGVINENPDIKLNRKEEDILSLTQTQTALLNNCCKYVKTGGKLYYSTCSILPEENDSVVYNFLQAHPEFELEIPSSPLNNLQTKFGLQFLPHISMGAGFFLTSFKRK